MKMGARALALGLTRSQFSPAPSSRGWRAPHWALVLALGLGLAGCDQAVTRVGDTAEATRTATEKMALRARQSSEDREAEIADAAAPMQEAEAIALGERYFLRADGQAWSVVDRMTGQPGSIGGQKLTNMDGAAARRALANLRADARGPVGGF